MIFICYNKKGQSFNLKKFIACPFVGHCAMIPKQSGISGSDQA